ncbi:MAG: DUF192 domain-containing protein [Pseudomonadota bacterium]
MLFKTIKHLAASGTIWASTAVGALAFCSAEHVDLRGDWGKVRFKVEIADDPQERAQGLMHRQSMARMSGMLFIYPEPEPLAFWMRNTLIPLDLLFIDESGVVVHIHENAVPLDETPISGGSDPLLSVLEINGGMSAMLGITTGSQLRHPGLPQDSAMWPCSE